MTLTLVVPDRSGLGPSGGDRYDAALAAQWRRLRRPVDVVAVAGGWPWPTPAEVARLEERVAGTGPGPVLLDGLVGCSAPQAVERCAALRPTAVLVHSLLAEGAGATGQAAAELDRREARALAGAHAVVTTSGWARERLAVRHGVRDAVVAPPGTSPAPVSAGSADSTGTPVLLCLGAVIPLKNHALLLAALEQVADLPWSLLVAGPAPDPDHLAALVAGATAHGLAGRVTWAGPLAGEELETAWHRTDLLVHPSRSETYGMAVAEALAHGIPAVVGAGTGAVEALTGRAHDGRAGGTTAAGLPGSAVATDHPDELVEVLRRWLSQAPLRRAWRAAALERREGLTGWDRTVEQVDRVLDRITV